MFGFVYRDNAFAFTSGKPVYRWEMPFGNYFVWNIIFHLTDNSFQTQGDKLSKISCSELPKESKHSSMRSEPKPAPVPPPSE